MNVKFTSGDLYVDYFLSSAPAFICLSAGNKTADVLHVLTADAESSLWTCL